MAESLFVEYIYLQNCNLRLLATRDSISLFAAMSSTSGGGISATLTGGSSRQSVSDMGDISETESDTSSLMGESINDPSTLGMKPPSPASREQLSKRIDSLLQENLRLKVCRCPFCH